MPRLYLDLDGVMADFEAHYLAVFGHAHDAGGDQSMWQWIGTNPTFFRDPPPCPGAIAFFDKIRSLDPIILTACPKSNYPSVATQKRAWVREHLSSDVTILPMLHGVNKVLFMHEPGDILIDDFLKNIDPWIRAGGVGILHEGSFYDTMENLNLALWAMGYFSKAA